MARRRRLAWLVVGAVMTLAASACGSSSHPSGSGQPGSTTVPGVSTLAGSPIATFTPYELRMQALGTTLNGLLNAVGTANAQDGTTPKTEARNLVRARVALRQAAAGLARIDPPSNVRAAHEQLRQAVLEYANELTPLIADANKGNQVPLATIVALEGIHNMTKASLAIKKKGYNIIGANDVTP